MASIRVDSLYIFFYLSTVVIWVLSLDLIYIYMKRTPNNYSNRYHFDVVFFFGHVSGFDRFKTFNEANDTDETVNVEINPKKP